MLASTPPMRRSRARQLPLRAVANCNPRRARLPRAGQNAKADSTHCHILKAAPACAKLHHSRTAAQKKNGAACCQGISPACPLQGVAGQRFGPFHFKLTVSGCPAAAHAHDHRPVKKKLPGAPRSEAWACDAHRGPRFRCVRRGGWPGRARRGIDGRCHWCLVPCAARPRSSTLLPFFVVCNAVFDVGFRVRFNF